MYILTITLLLKKKIKNSEEFRARMGKKRKKRGKREKRRGKREKRGGKREKGKEIIIV